MSGFTLIELMIVVGIVGILAVVALPSMQDLVVANRMKSVSMDIYTSLALARSEAIKRNNGSVSMIPAAGGWQNGWTVTCVDTAGSCGGADVLITTGDAVASTLTLTGPAGNVTFSRDGRLASAAASFKIVYTANNPRVPMRCVDLGVSGRPNTRADTNGTDSDGCN